MSKEQAEQSEPDVRQLVAENRLRNGGFEADWSEEKSHRALVVPASGEPYIQDVGNIFTAPGWLAWFRHEPGKWDQPEVRDAWKSGDPLRVFSGDKAILLFTFYRRHDAGFMQTADVMPGRRYRLEAFAHAWSNHEKKLGQGPTPEFPHPDDPRWSEGVGYDRASLRPEQIPLLNGDAQNDAVGNFLFILGVDPTGGNDPDSDDVIWGTPVANYNGHSLVPAVEAVAQTDRMTVYLRSMTLWAFKHNDAYWDDASLVEMDGQPPEPPERQYQRYYVLLPPDASKEEVGAAVDRFYEARRTIGFSADDAGVKPPEVTRRTVHALHADRWPGGGGGLAEFYRTYYPGIDELIVEEDEPQSPVTELRLTYPTTHLPPVITGRFNEPRPGYVHKGLDLRSSWRVWKDEILAAFRGRVIVSGVLSSEPGYGVQIQTEIKLADGRTVRVRYAHLVVGSQRVIVGDSVTAGQLIGLPDSTGNSTADHLHLDVRVNGVYVDPQPLIDWPGTGPGEPQHPYRGEPISLHIQAGGQGDAEFIQRVRPAVVKLVLGMERAYWIKGLSPGSRVLYRHFPNYKNHLDPYIKHPGGAYAGAKMFVAEFLPALLKNADAVDYVESLNEIYSTGDTDGIKRSVEFDCNFCRVMEEEGLPAKPVVLISGVGNPQHGEETRLLRDAARELARLGGAAAHHGYFGNRIEGTGYYSTLRAGLSKHYSMRGLLSWDPEFVAAGIYVDHILSESGSCYIAPNGSMPSATAGWKYKETLKGNWGWCVAEILELRRQILEWNKTHGNRCVGVNLFTVGGGSDEQAGWPWWELAGRLVDLAAALAP